MSLPAVDFLNITCSKGHHTCMWTLDLHSLAAICRTGQIDSGRSNLVLVSASQSLDEYFGSDQPLSEGDQFLKQYVLNKVCLLLLSNTAVMDCA